LLTQSEMELTSICLCLENHQIWELLRQALRLYASVVEINGHVYEYNSVWDSNRTEIWRLKVDDRGWRYATFNHDSRILQAFIPAANCD
jgi:hypothetical protein